MKEALSELRATIRRLSPHLLVQPFPKPVPYPPPSTKERTSVTENGKGTISSQGKASNAVSVQDELQVEATKELVNAISSVLWCLDLLWDGCSPAAEEGDEKKTSNDAIDTHDRKAVDSRSNREPYTEWNEEAKSLIREGYGLLVTISSPSFVKKDCRVHNYDHQYLQREDRQQQEDLRLIVRTSILELLPSVNTSACRHFLLEFLPHFIPLSILAEKGRVIHDEDKFWSPPSWLERHDELHVCSAAESLVVGADDSKFTTLVETAMEQYLETFQSLIQIDPSTLASFLATMSLLFENLPASTEKNLVLEEVDTSESLDSESPVAGVRKKCCHLCISSLPSVSEHDLPSIIHSLFTLVRDEEDGRLAVQAIRKEWISINNSQPKEDSILFIGNVVILFLLADEVLSSKYVAMGFLDEVTESLRAHLASCNETKNEAGSCHERSASSSFLSTLDALVVTTLYSQPRYQQTIESIIDSLISRQSFIVFDLIFPLIRIWQSGNRHDRSSIESLKKDHANLLFYDPLASPLISLLFYLCIATSSSEMSCGYLDFVRVGGVLPFLSAETASSAASNKNQALSFDCCKALAELYCVVDCQRREQIINSLFSMISDSFIQSAPTSYATNKPQRSGGAPSLIDTAYSACCTLLLLSDSHLADVAQTRSASLDRLLSLASLSPSTTLISEEKDHVMYILFDMHSVLLTAFMQGTSDRDARDRSGVSELLIISQKLLFSSRATLADDNDNQHRVACGIILASRLLRCHNISRSERKDVWNSVVKILSPPTPSSTAPSRKLKPEIGIWGLAFLRFASSNLRSVTDSKPSDSASHIPRFVETGSVCGEKDMFSLVNNMLAAAGVIQMENSLKVSPQSSSGKPITFLAYNDVPVHYSKEAPTPRFVVCAPYFLSGMFLNEGGEGQSRSLLADDKKQMPASVHVTANYLYDLVDCYLQLGKCRKQGWNPIGWLLAKVQLPCCLPESIMDLLHMKKYHQLEIESPAGSFRALNFSLGANESPWKRIAAEILNLKKSRAAIVQSLVEFMNCIIISISVSCAILKHANEHFQHQSTLLSFTTTCSTQIPPKPSTSECNDQSQQKKKKKRLGALQKLLQFQFAKIQHMHSICEGILFALKCIYTEVCRISHAQASTHKGPRLSQERKRTHEFKTQFIDSHELNTPLFRISLAKLKYTVAAFELSIMYKVRDTSVSTLWNCLLDDADDKFLFETIRISATPIKVNTKTSSVSSYEKVHHIIRLRANTLRELQHHFILISANTVHSLSQERYHLLFEESLRGIPRVFSSMITLSSCIQNFSKTNQSTSTKRDTDLDRQSILAFIYYHNNVLLAAFSSHTQDLLLTLSVFNDDMSVPKQRRKLLIQPHTNNCSVYLSSLLRACAATVSKDDDCASVPLGNITKILKEQLIQQFKRCEDSATSCQIIDLISVFIIHIDIDEASTVLADLSRKALNSVYSTTFVKVGIPVAFFKIWHSLKNIEKRGTESDYVVILQDSFSRLFQTANTIQKRSDPSTCTFIHNILTHWSALVLCGASHHKFFFELCELIDEVIANSFNREPRRFNRSSKKAKLSGLNEKSCVAVFELFIQMVVTSLSLSRPSRVCRDRDDTIVQSENGPYHKVVKAFVAFDRMLRLFRDYHKFFPQRIFFSVNRATLHVIKLGIHLFQVCVEWRNSQSLSLQNLNGEDPAGVCFLQPLIAAIACNCIGSIEAFCDSFKRSTAASKTSDARSGLSYRHSRAIAGLLFKCDRTREILQNISRTQNLMMPSQVFIPSQNEMLHEKAIQNEVSRSENHRQSKRTADFPNRSSKRQRYDAKWHPSTVLEQIDTAFDTFSDSSSDNIIRDLDDNKDTGSHDEGSFGAVGDWG